MHSVKSCLIFLNIIVSVFLIWISSIGLQLLICYVECFSWGNGSEREFLKLSFICQREILPKMCKNNWFHSKFLFYQWEEWDRELWMVQLWLTLASTRYSTGRRSRCCVEKRSWTPRKPGQRLWETLLVRVSLAFQVSALISLHPSYCIIPVFTPEMYFTISYLIFWNICQTCSAKSYFVKFYSNSFI